MNTFVQDLRYAVRMLLKSPGFTLVAVIVLALGIGANATIFSIINAILIKPLPIRDPEQLVGVYQHDRDNPDAFSLFSYPDFCDLRANREAAFNDLFAFALASVGLQGDVTERTSVGLVSADYFSALGVPPMLGRVMLPQEETNGAPVGVLTYSFWTRLGADPSIVGRKLKLTRGEVTVVGVMPRDFSGAQVLAPAMFLPLGMAETLASNPGEPAPRVLTNRADRRFMLMGRLKPGLTLSNVGGALAILNQQFAIPDPAAPKARTLICTPPPRFNFGDTPAQETKAVAPPAAFAIGLSMLVLAVACLNLANMMLAHGAARRKEIAVRLALGAGRRRVLRQLLTEGLLLSLAGGAGGLLVSVWATNLLAAFIYSGSGMPEDFPKFDLSPDWRVVLALLFVGGLATLLFALGPAWKLARLDINSDLKRHAGEDAGARKGRFGPRELLAVGQMAFALALLVTAALFTRSAMNAARANPGFEFGSNFYLSLDFTLAAYSEPRERELIRTATERLSALPGVESVSPAVNIPFGNSDWGCAVQLGGAPPASNGAATPAEGRALEAVYNIVGSKYFRTMGISLLRGREFDRREAEAANAPRVAIISQNLASQLWPGADAIGRSIQFPGANPVASPVVMTVVGVVPAIHWRVFEKELPAEVYVPLGREFQPNLKLHVRVAPGVDPASLMTAAREELRRLDSRVPLTEVKTLVALHRDGPMVRVAHLGSMLFGTFGVLAMLLSVLDIYGLKAYSVARRTREIGIRMALGASRRDVVGMILRETTWLAGLGLGVGLLLALAVGRLAGSFLYRVPATDPLTFSVVPPLLLAMAMVACIIPARRAAKLDPIAALRHE